jgi:hypothetical protein
VPVAVETTAEVPSEAKSMGEVVPAPTAAEPEPTPDATAAPAPTPTPTPPTPAATQEVVAHTAAPASEVTAQPTAATEAAPVATSVNAPAAVEPKIKEEPVLTFPLPLKEGEGESEEPRGLWGGFWRRRED